MRIYQGALIFTFPGSQVDGYSLRPKELGLLSAPPGGGDDLAEFYIRFEKIKDFHRKNQNINSRQFVNELDELVRGDGVQTMQLDPDEDPVIIDCTS